MINDLGDLKKLFRLCRAQGITDFEMQGLKIKFGDMPQATGQADASLSVEDPTNPYANFPQGELSPEQLMFYSSGGKPEDDPILKDAAP